ncbi:MAG: hypothetical protein AB9856_20915 [Cellulosilyticaceae bacterium]
MSDMMIKFVQCGVYKTEEQATGIANALLMSTCFTQEEYSSVIVAIQAKFNPQPIETVPLTNIVPVPTETEVQ